MKKCDNFGKNVIIDISKRVKAPNSNAGAILIWLSLLLGVVVLSYFSVSECNLFERILFSAVLGMPVIIIAKNGHFGYDRFEFPTIVAQIYLIWNIAVLPSLASAMSSSIGTYQFKYQSKMLGSLIFLLWFIIFSVFSGKKSEKQNDNFRISINKNNNIDNMIFLVLFVLYLFIVFNVGNQGMLSSWGYSFQAEELINTKFGVIFLLYSSFVGILPLLSLWAWMKSDGKWKIVFAAIFLLSVIILVMYSSRRISIITALTGVFLYSKMYGKLNIKILIIAATSVWVMTGPLLWPLRVALQNPDLFGAQESTFQVAKNSFLKYLTDREFREMTSNAGKNNLKDGRFNYADPFLSTVEWANENGPNGSPSFLFAPVTMVPSFIWPNKNEIAANLNVKKQFNALGISNEPDFPMSPIQEIYFQYSYFGVIFGGLFWGIYSRILMNNFDRACVSFNGMLLWCSFVFGAFSFEGYFSMFLPLVRESVVLAGIIFVAKRYIIKNQLMSRLGVVRIAEAGNIGNIVKKEEGASE